MSEHIQSPISLTGVGKCYRIFQNPQDRFKQALMDRFHGITRRTSTHGPLYREHWALRHITFTLQPGEAVGILGRNGAGKSTLLQIIAGTLEPTEGAVSTSGRITALLELGSGFNPEFTGRENVLLNAQILGLSREEALAKFDEIASFADIGEYIDQPVKTYSSGMMMRLAFSVQTAVDPKVLIVDEALSVGDMFFQAKCMARIRRLVDAGVALLFVSHDVGVVRQICSRALLLANGEMVGLGPSRTITDRYIKSVLDARNASSAPKSSCEPAPDDGLIGGGNPAERHDADDRAASASNRESDENGRQPNSSDGFPDWNLGRESFLAMAKADRVGNGTAEVINVQMLKHGNMATDFDFGEEAIIRVAVRFKKNLENVMMAIKIRTLQGVDVVFFDTRIQEEMNREYGAGLHLFTWRIRLPLMHGSYALFAGLSHPPLLGEDWVFIDVVPHAYVFSVAPRRGGMIDGFVSMPAQLSISRS